MINPGNEPYVIGERAYCGATDKPLQPDCGWLRRKRLDERAFLVRHLEINAALRQRFATELCADGHSVRDDRSAPPAG